MNIRNNILVTKLDDFGRGIGYVDNKIIFIKNALPDEIVDVDIVKDTKKYYEGNVIKYIKVSDKRKEVKCPFYDRCGGCNLLHITYDDSIQYKVDKVKNILNKFASIKNNIEIIKNDKPFNYRNKIELKIENNKWGYYNSSTHNFVEINECLIAKKSINDVIFNREFIRVNNGSITIRSNYNDEIILSIETNEDYFFDIEGLKEKIKLVGIVVNDKLIYGESYFIEKVKNKFFKVNYNSFFQINLCVASKISNIISEYSFGENLLDLYCGVGFLGQLVSDKYKKIYGIEINENSIIDAIKNSNINDIKNTYYLCGSTDKLIYKIKDNIDTIIVDPPRSGLVKNTINDVLKINAERIIYISCNPVSLARDLSLLKDNYDVEKIYMLDMFSNTYHVECVSVLNRKSLEK